MTRMILDCPNYEEDIDPDLQNAHGQTVLHHAVLSSTEITQMLLDCEAFGGDGRIDVNAQV